MNQDNIKLIGGVVSVIAILVFSICIFVFTVSYSEAVKNAETKIVNITNADIIIEDDDFYILSPDGKKISLGLSGGEVLDLTKHSEILVKIKRYPSWGLYGGSDWFVDGVLKKP